MPEADRLGDGATPSGAINFSDPRPGINLFALDGDPYSKPQLALTPDEGTLLMWPASVMHNVYPNMSTEKRITISFNIILEFDNRYLE